MEKIPLETALMVSTSNPAQILKLKNKGRIRVGMDADILLLDKDLNIHSVFALGEMLMENGVLTKKGAYER